MLEIYNKNHFNEIIIEVFITDSCNLNCVYCINLSNNYKRKNINLNLFQLYIFIEYLRVITDKSIQLIFIGGEPTLHPDLLAFCEKIKDHKYINLIIYTNFQKSEQYYIDFVQYNNVQFKISFHYIDELETKKFIEKMQLLTQTYHLKIYEIIVMLTDNFNNCIDVYSKIKYKFDNISCSLLVKTDNYTPNYTIAQLDQYYCLYRDMHNTDIIINTKNTRKENVDFFKIIDNICFYKWQCNAGKGQFFIDLHGNIFPCRNNQKLLSTIFEYTHLKLQNILCLYTGKCTNEISYRKQIFK